MMFCHHSKCHILSLAGRGSNGLLFPTSPGDSRVSKLKHIVRKIPSGIEAIAIKCMHTHSQFELNISRIDQVSVLKFLGDMVTLVLLQ